MDSNMYTQWVQSPVQESAQHEPRADEWPKDRPVGANGGSPTIDMSDFTTLGDIGGSSTSSLLPTSSQSFYSYGQSYFVPAHFPQIAYPTPWPTSLPVSSYSTLNGATTSSSAQSHQQQHSPTQQLGQQQQQSQHQQQQQSIQHPSTSQHMIIDPPILTLNGSNSSHLQQSFSHSPPFSPQLTSQQQQQQQQQQQAQRPPQYYAQQQPHLIYPSPYYRHQTPAIPQGTLSPQSLHSPTTNSMMGIPPNSFYASLQGGPLQHEQLQQLSTLSMQTVASPVASTSQAQSPTEPTPAPGLTQEQKEERKLRFQNLIRPFLQSTAFTGAGAVNQLTNLIIDYGVTEVDASMRLEILARIRDGAGNHYYRAWCENANAIDITREWIKAAAKGNNAALIETTMPLLHLLDRLPLSIETLTSSKIGKVIKKLAKDEPIAAIKDMASNLENRWRTMVNDAKEKVESKPGEGSDAKTKNLKRKPTEPASSVKVAAPSKKPNLGQTASSASIKPVAVKKEPSLITIPKATAGPVKDAKADSSFFSAPKPKAKLPSFKKAPIQVLMKKEDANIAQPSSINPFEEALKSMKTRNSPAVSTPPAISSTSTSESQPGLAKNGKKRKTVSWAPDDQLEQIREIQRAIYDDDPIDGTHVSHSYRDLERGEGQALSKPVFEETIDWAEPLLVEMTPESEGTPGKTPKGGNSEEKLRQEEREQTALGAIFMSLSQIPESPAEPNIILTEEDTDKNVTHMTVGPELDGFFFHNIATAAAPTASVADLVGQLGNNQMDSSMENSLNLNANGVASNAGPPQDPLAGLSPDQITALLQQFSKSMLPVTGGAFGEISPYGNNGTGDSSWSSTPPQYGNSYGSGYIEDSQQSDPSQSRWPSERGAGGRGRGRSRGRGRGEDGYRPYIKRKPCSFFAAGRCKYGDHCDFAHDLSLLEH